MDSVKTSVLAHPWLQVQFMENTVRAYLYSVAFVLLGWLLILFLDRVVMRRVLKLAERTDSGFDDYLILSLKRYGIPALYAAVFYLGVRDLAMREAVAKALQLGVYFWIAINVVRFVSGLIQAALERHMESRAESAVVAEQEKKSVRGILVFVKIVLWVLAFILVMDNLGVKVTTFVAGLGIGGIAVALALQNVLSDLFASLSIALDKPFVIGDFLVIGEFRGNVEQIGLKTTRLRSLSGEQLIFSNADLLSSRIRNYQRMDERRAEFAVGVVYETPAEKLERIPAMLREVIEAVDDTRFDRAHFKSFGDFSLNFEIIYFVGSRDYNLFMDIQQVINLEIFRRFEAEDISFAYPTRTLYMDPSESFQRALLAGAPPSNNGRRDNGTPEARR